MIFTKKRDSKKILIETVKMCKNKCGFYGNVIWQGYCSKCYREYIRTVTVDKKNGRQLIATAGIDDKNEQSKSPKINMKDLKEKKFLKTRIDALKKKIDNKELEPDNSSSPYSKLNKQLSNVRKDGEIDLLKRIKTVVDKIKNGNLNADACSDLIQEMYQTVSDKLQSDIAFSKLSQDEKQNIFNSVEECVCLLTYNNVFSPPDDEQQDLLLQERIRSLNWLNAQMLDAGIDETISEANTALESAITTILQLSSMHTPADKLDCIMKCSHHIVAALKASCNQQVSADNFLPALIFVLLRANPPLLKSNENYIMRFASSSRVGSGEQAYYFTNLSGALEFIVTLNADSLSMPSQEFERCMRGEAIPGDPGKVYGCEQLRLMKSNFQVLENLVEVQKNLSSEIKQFKEEMLEFETLFKNKLTELVEKTPLPIRKPILPDAETPTIDSADKQLLPNPLIPTKAFETLSSIPVTPCSTGSSIISENTNDISLNNTPNI